MARPLYLYLSVSSRAHAPAPWKRLVRPSKLSLTTGVTPEQLAERFAAVEMRSGEEQTLVKVHSNCIITDAKYLIRTSSNLLDRSLWVKADSELGVGVASARRPISAAATVQYASLPKGADGAARFVGRRDQLSPRCSSASSGAT